MNRFPKAFIIISVLLNLLLAGIVIGHVGHCFMGQNKHITARELATALPVDKRESLEDTVSRNDKAIATLRQQLADARKKAAGILKSGSFNKEAYLAQVQAIQGLKVQIQQRLNDAVIGLAAESNPGQRAAMADMLFP